MKQVVQGNGEKLRRTPSLKKASCVVAIACHKILDFHVVCLKLPSATRVGGHFGSSSN